jgi:hypothetical protein
MFNNTSPALILSSGDLCFLLALGGTLYMLDRVSRFILSSRTSSPNVCAMTRTMRYMRPVGSTTTTRIIRRVLKRKPTSPHPEQNANSDSDTDSQADQEPTEQVKSDDTQAEQEWEQCCVPSNYGHSLVDSAGVPCGIGSNRDDQLEGPDTSDDDNDDNNDSDNPNPLEC